MITLLQILILGLVQGAAEMLPVSSSAHVIAAEKLLGIQPSSPAAMFLMAMLHTGSMFAVLLYFWSAWKETFFSSRERFYSMASRAAVATVLTGVVGYGLIKAIEVIYLKGTPSGDVEELANNLKFIAAALVVAGIWIVLAGLRRREPATGDDRAVSMPTAAWMGFAQGLVLPFRGLSRSGVTISTGLFGGASRRRAEEFSFALAVIITPAAIVREVHRVLKANPGALHNGTLSHVLAPGLIGLVASFVAALIALKLLSSWLEEGRWVYFGYYCLAAAAGLFAMAAHGY